MPAVPTPEARRREFMDLLQNLFERIDDLAQDDRINSQEYIIFADLCLELRNARQNIAQHTVYVQHMERRRRANRPTHIPTTIMVDRESAIRCQYCAQWYERTYIETHQRNTRACFNTRQVNINSRVNVRGDILIALNNALYKKHKPINNARSLMSDFKMRVLGVSTIEEFYERFNINHQSYNRQANRNRMSLPFESFQTPYRRTTTRTSITPENF